MLWNNSYIYEIESKPLADSLKSWHVSALGTDVLNRDRKFEGQQICAPPTPHPHWTGCTASLIQPGGCVGSKSCEVGWPAA